MRHYRRHALEDLLGEDAGSMFGGGDFVVQQSVQQRGFVGGHDLGRLAKSEIGSVVGGGHGGVDRGASLRRREPAGGGEEGGGGGRGGGRGSGGMLRQGRQRHQWVAVHMYVL